MNDLSSALKKCTHKYSHKTLTITHPYIEGPSLGSGRGEYTNMIPRFLFIIVVTYSLVVETYAFGVSEPKLKDNANTKSNTIYQRRKFLQSTAAITAASWTSGSNIKSPIVTPVSPAYADVDVSTAVVEEVPMKLFVDTANPSLFSINVPTRFFSIRRTFKYDLPDAKTGKGRRGGTIYSAGDMSKAEVIAVERYVY